MDNRFIKVRSIVLTLALLTCCTLADAELDQNRTNFIERFNIDHLDDFVKERKFVMVLANKADSQAFKLNMLFFEAAKKFEPKEVFFVQIDANEATDEQLKQHDLVVTPATRMYIYGIPKHFTLQLTSDNLNEWIEQILMARYIEIEDVDSIQHHDKHYFVYAQQEWVNANKAHFNVLSKLISPLSIYTGFDLTKLPLPENSEAVNHPIFAYREIDSKVFPIGKELTLRQKADLILDHEFAESVECNPSSLRLIIDYKIPSLIYYGDGDLASEDWENVKAVHHSYKEFLLLIYANVNSSDPSCKFLMDFMKVDEPDHLRILNMTKDIRRYAFVGTFEKPDLSFFLINYIEGNLKKYILSEKLKKNEQVFGIDKANYRTLKQATRNLKNNVLFYVHNNAARIPLQDVQVLQLIKDVTRTNSTFKIYFLDHAKNDIDGYHHEKLPLIFLVTRLGQLEYFEEEMSEENILRFLLQHIPYLKLEDPVIDDGL
jgi:hypothetical protein